MSLIVTDGYCEPCMFVKIEYIKAELFCADCRERYCELCALDHAKFRVLRNHHVVNIKPETVDYENEKIGAPIPIIQVVDDSLSDTFRGPSAFAKNRSDYELVAVRSPGSVSSETKSESEEPETKQDVNTQDSRSFQVRIIQTDMVRRLKAISDADIENSFFTFTVNSAGISLTLREKRVFHCSLSTIRRYGKRQDRIKIEVGRACAFGQGEILLKSERVSDIQAYLATIMNKQIK